MAEVDTGSGGGKGKHKKKGTKKVSTKIDMTPMVDLAFLLITFFMLTTTFNKPQTMEVNYPDKTEDKTVEQKIAEGRTCVLMPDENDKIYYFFGENSKDVQVTDFSEKGLRAMLIKRRREVIAKYGEDKGPIYVVKSTSKAKYKNLVDLIDEFFITQSTQFAIVKITPEDQAVVDKTKGLAAAAPAAQ
jgi:biopolymer transport protein ExbD